MPNKKKIARISLIVIGALLLAVALVVSNSASEEKTQALQDQQNAIMATRGELVPFDMNMSEDFVVKLGSNTFSTNAQALAQGFDPVSVLNLGSSWPFQIGFSNGKMSISANITNSNNEVIAYIENDSWKSVSPNSMEIGDRNYNVYAFEIVDLNTIPIFNVEILGSNTIQISGVFNMAGGKVLISDNGGGIIGNPSEQNITQNLVPIFKYPSSEYLGELINPAYPTPPDTWDGMFSDASVKTNVSYVLTFFGTLFVAIFGADSILDFREKKKYEKENEARAEEIKPSPKTPKRKDKRAEERARRQSEQRRRKG
jgi:hypothetical protein